MDIGKNPYSPGAGTRPPELAGREHILTSALVALERVKNGRSEKSSILVGLRGVGKTVLLNEIQELAESNGYKVAYIEMHESRQKKSLSELLIPQLRRILLQLDYGQMASEQVKKGFRVLKSFISSFKASFAEIEWSFDPEIGIADSGDLEMDLADLFVALGAAAKDRGTAIAIIIDELQYVEEKELSAFIMAMHRVSQKSLPLIIIGAGLPQLVGKAGNSKSYAERLFAYPKVGALNLTDAKTALQQPVKEMGVEYTEEALEEIYRQTQGYPYFLQEWGYQAWNLAQGSPITIDVIHEATRRSIERLDESFFRVRLDRLTPMEKKYVRALADLGSEPQRSGDIADRLGKPVNAVAPIRSNLIAKGMIYSPAHGDTSFTVPLFEEFLKREIPNFLPNEDY